MNATIHSVAAIESDNPIALLTRRRLYGDRMLWAHVCLEEGCEVATHQHDNEQIAFVITGKVRWLLGEPGSADYSETITEGGTVVHLPGGFPHGVIALEDTVILDVLSPPGEMGVDHQSS
jgi:quercetin dioxygenase-like cupin family protein